MRKSATMSSVPRSAPPTPKVRARRDPEEAKRLILDAAERVFAARGPDAVGLADVAREAGVSHALVSHYFGTYDGLVDAALERRAQRVRTSVFAELADENTPPDPAALLDRLWSWVADPVTLRLAAWAALANRKADDFFPARVKGLRMVADALEARMPEARDRRDDLEFVIGAAVSLAFGYALMRPAISLALGKRPTDMADKAFRARVVELFVGYLTRK